MSRLLPPSTNAQYAGSPGAPRILAALAVLTILPACIHSFLPDGGAGVIAGLDMAACRQLVVALFHHFLWSQALFSVGSQDWSHAFMVPLISVYILWQRRAELARAPARLVWRASLEDPHSGERLAFRDQEALFAFLRDLLAG